MRIALMGSQCQIQFKVFLAQKEIEILINFSGFWKSKHFSTKNSNEFFFQNRGRREDPKVNQLENLIKYSAIIFFFSFDRFLVLL
jgi:hypothetical protein